TEDVGALSPHILGSHVDHARQTEMCTGGSRGHAVLPCARFRNDSLLAHPQRQQSLAQRVIDLVRPGVVEVLAFEPDLCTTGQLAQPPCMIDGARPPYKVL